jgi:hypothetical protein
VSQKDQPEHGHGIFAGGEFGIGAKLVGRFPKVML